MGARQTRTSPSGQWFVFKKNIALWVPVRHDTLSGGDVKVCLFFDSAWQWVGAFRVSSLAKGSCASERLTYYETLTRRRKDYTRW